MKQPGLFFCFQLCLYFWRSILISTHLRFHTKYYEYLFHKHHVITHVAYKNKNGPKEKNSTNCCLESTIFFLSISCTFYTKNIQQRQRKVWKSGGGGTSSNKNSFKETRFFFCFCQNLGGGNLPIPTDSAVLFLVSTTMSLIARRKKKNKKPYCLVRGRFVHFLKSRVCVLADLKG